MLSVFPYGYVIKNVNNNASRDLPANPAANQYDGEVTFSFQIPLQPLATDDPFKISRRFQTADDTNTRVTQSTYEQNFAGDVAALARVNALGSDDLVVLGGRLSQTTIGNPICGVRIAGPNASPTAYLVNQVPASPAVLAAPSNLSSVPPTSEVALGFCNNVASPTASTLVVNGSMSGRRRLVGSPYRGVLQGGGATNRPNQIIYDITGEKPYFRGEIVNFTATAGNTSGGNPITPFVGSFRVAGSIASANGSFVANAAWSLGNAPRIITAHLNGDGFLDVVSANQISDDLTIRLGDGLGGFAAATTKALGTAAYQVAAGDMNGDGEVDLVVALGLANAVGVLLGDGAGGFANAVMYPTAGVRPGAVALGDVNGDGKLDVVTADSLSGGGSIMLGDGLGSLAAATSYSGGSQPSDVKLVDLDGDGKLDIVSPSITTSHIRVLRGNGTGTFLAAQQYAAATGRAELTIADVNGDGKLDLLYGNSTANEVTVLIGNGAGGFAAGFNYALPAGSLPFSIAVADLNADGKLDLIVGNFALDTATVKLGQ